jgi:hypothetical protein
MAFIQNSISGQAVKNATIRVAAPRSDNLLGSNYEIDDYVLTAATGDLNYIDNRLNDPRYYTGDNAT